MERKNIAQRNNLNEISEKLEQRPLFLLRLEPKLFKGLQVDSINKSQLGDLYVHKKLVCNILLFHPSYGSSCSSAERKIFPSPAFQAPVCKYGWDGSRFIYPATARL